MKSTFKINLLLLTLSLMCGTVNCSRFSDDEFTTNNPSLSSTSLTLEFEGEVNTTSYRSIVFSNFSENEYYEIFNIAEVNDECSAFALLNITNNKDDVLFDPKAQNIDSTSDYSLSVAVAPGETVNLNIEFSPIPCAKKEYSPELNVYYKANEVIKSHKIIMHTQVIDLSVSATCGTMYQVSELDEVIGEEPSRVLPALPEDQYYAIVPYAFRGYIQPTEGFASLATEIYAYFDNPRVPEPGYLAPYLPLEYVGEGQLKFSKIDECRGLQFPTSKTDTYFLGAKQIITTEKDFDIHVETQDPENLGSMNVNNITLRLDSNVNNSSSILQNENGNFAIQFETSLTTGFTPTNNYLQNSVGKIFDENGKDILRIEQNGDESRLYGSPLRHGEVILVGIGTFVPTGYVMSAEATSGLIDTPAYLFIQIHAKVVILNESEIPKASQRIEP